MPSRSPPETIDDARAFIAALDRLRVATLWSVIEDRRKVVFEAAGRLVATLGPHPGLPDPDPQPIRVIREGLSTFLENWRMCRDGVMVYPASGHLGGMIAFTFNDRLAGVLEDMREAVEQATERWEPASWFDRYGVSSESLRKAASGQAPKIRKRKDGKRNLYSVADVRKTWPKAFTVKEA